MADKRIDQLVAATEVGDNDLLVMQQSDTAKKVPGSVLKNYVYAAGADMIEQVREAVADAQKAVDGIEAQKDTIAQSIASMAELGTDTTLTTPGVAADAKTTGDKIKTVAPTIESMIAGREDTMVTTTNYVSGALVVANGALYKLDANVTSGETLVPSRNCHATTIDSELAAVNYNISYATSNMVSTTDLSNLRTDLEEDINETSDEVSDLKNAIAENYGSVIKHYNIIDGVLEAAFANIGGTYIINPNANERIIYFPITSGNIYTVYKGYSMASCRIGYTTELPKLNDSVTGYADFSTSAIYNTFTASQNGYACVRITYANDVTTIENVLSTCCVYEGAYDNTKARLTAYLENVKAINGKEWSDILASVNAIQYENIIMGYLDAQVTTTITQSTNFTKGSVYFPVKGGARYTVDKKVFTAHTRIAYTANVPKYGDSTSNYTILDDGNGCSHITFTAAQDGYAALWVLDTASTSGVTIDFIKQNTIVYEGDYRPNYTKETLNILDTAVDANHIFYCGAGRELATLKAGVEKATQYMGATLYVDAGTYDLVTEFGSSWFESLTETSYQCGLQLKNRVHIIFSPNSKVVSHYTGDNEYAQKLYSPFNAGEYGFTIENLTLECSRCRYGIHDERNGATEEYKARYINCNVSIDNSENDYFNSHHPLGGGLGTNAEIIIENCVWASDQPSVRWGVSYHTANTQDQNKKTKVVVKDCYFVSGTVCLEDAGANSNVGKSDFIITNCSFPIKYDGTDAQGVFHLNLSDEYNNVYDWNNVFRTT